MALDAFTLTAGSFSAGELHVLSFRGREEVSRPFRFDLTVAVRGTTARDIEGELLGQLAVLRLEVPGGDGRPVCGMVTRVDTLHALDDGTRAVRVKLVPRLAWLARRVTSRIFQNETVPQIVSTVLRLAAVPHRSALVTKYPKRTYCVQYRESDLAFVTRLLAEEGIWYFFEHNAEETLVLADGADLYGSIAGDPKLVVRERQPGDALLGEERDVFRFDAHRVLTSGAVLHRDHDFRRPALDRRAEASTMANGSTVSDDLLRREAVHRVYDHDEDEDEVPNVERSPAALRLEQLRRHAARASGVSACRRLVPGFGFELTDHPLDDLDGRYAITSVTHEGRSHDRSADGEPRYANRFVCVRATLGLRPKRPRRVLQQVTETARVVGLEGQEIHTDDLGRVKVQFQWDLDGKRNEKSSCWVRVATAWAGAGWGAQFVPRVGMAVLVTFVSGKADRPVIIGCLYTGANRPPFALPGSRTRSGIVTRSSPLGARGSELSFEDALGRERVVLYGARDLIETAAWDRDVVVGHDEHVQIAGNAATRVAGNQTAEVEGTLKQTAGRRILSSQGDVAERIGGRSTTEIAASQSVSIGRHHLVHVRGSSDLVVGTPGQADHHAITVQGDHVLAASGSIVVRAQRALTLACGDSTLELSPEGVRIRAKRVEIVGSESASMTGNGPVLQLAEDAQLRAGTVRVLAEKSSLVMNSDARVKAEFIMLNCGDEPRPATNPDAAPVETQPFKTKLSDAEYGVWSYRRYQLRVDGHTLEGTTDGDGLVAQTIPKSATSVTLVVWFADYPTGPTQTRTIRLAPLGAASTLLGAAIRLAHLGYFHGEPQNATSDGLVPAVKDFQGHVGLPVTGALDPPTLTKLDALHGK
jgi:type VI secretion system secreted protein VgrG